MNIHSKRVNTIPRDLKLSKRIRKGVEYESPFYIHTFNQFTRPSDYYGDSSMQDGKLVFRNGPLTKSMKEGKVFIGDEFNISSEDCMKSITPCLELKYNIEG